MKNMDSQESRHHQTEQKDHSSGSRSRAIRNRDKRSSSQVASSQEQNDLMPERSADVTGNQYSSQ